MRRKEGEEGRMERWEGSRTTPPWLVHAKGSRVVILLWMCLSIPHWRVTFPLVAMVILGEIECMGSVPTKASYNITAGAK